MVITGTTQEGDSVFIPKGAVLHFAENTTDWRRVVVLWGEKLVTISHIAWESCEPLR